MGCYNGGALCGPFPIFIKHPEFGGFTLFIIKRCGGLGRLGFSAHVSSVVITTPGPASGVSLSWVTEFYSEKGGYHLWYPQ